MQVFANDLLTTYKYGWKTSYYHNTFDDKKDEDEGNLEEMKSELESLIAQLENIEEDDCESCKI
jgi:ribonucleoside-diphosphate reductase alpha chain